MRIIAGKYKGHKLISFDEDHIRPTTDRVKESVFNIAAANLIDARVLDLYSGTGNLSFESLSRGAKSVVAVEVNPRSIAIIKKNAEHLKIEDGFQILKKDVLEFINKYDGEPFDVILVDPPFPLKICKKTLEAISESPVAGSETLIIIEHARQEPLESEIGNLRSFDSRHYGDKLVTFYNKKV